MEKTEEVLENQQQKYMEMCRLKNIHANVYYIKGQSIIHTHEDILQLFKRTLHRVQNYVSALWR